MNIELSLEVDVIREYVIDVIDVTREQTYSVKKVEASDIKPCNREHVRHLDENRLTNLAEHQMHVKGKHKCCQCAYNSGYEQGALLQEFISLDVASLGDSHSSNDGSHKCVHQAFALGYSDGVNSFMKS